MLFSSLVSAHVIFSTLGYVGLIASNLWLLLLCRDERTETLVDAIRVWRRLARLFGPLLGLGVLCGFWLATVVHAPLGTRWLLATYVLIVLALGTQATIMVPWQLRADRSLAQGVGVSTRPIIVVLVIFSVAYASNLMLMLLRPA